MREEPLIFGCFNEREAPCSCLYLAYVAAKREGAFSMVAVTREEAPYFGCFNERRDFQQVVIMREEGLSPMAIGLSICPVPREDPIDPLCSLTLLRGTGDFLGRSSAPTWETFPGPSGKSLKNRFSGPVLGQDDESYMKSKEGA